MPKCGQGLPDKRPSLARSGVPGSYGRRVDRQVFLGVVKSDGRRKESHTLAGIGVEEVSHLASQDGTDDDVRVENDHLSSAGRTLLAATQFLELRY